MYLLYGFHNETCSYAAYLYPFALSPWILNVYHFQNVEKKTLYTSFIIKSFAHWCECARELSLSQCTQTNYKNNTKKAQLSKTECYFYRHDILLIVLYVVACFASIWYGECNCLWIDFGVLSLQFSDSLLTGH